MSSGTHEELVERFRYFDGHSDTIGLFADAGFLRRAAAGVATPFRDVHVDTIGPKDRVLVVDDWAEAGSKALTARRLIESCGARYLGLSLLVDQPRPEVRGRLEPVAAVALASDLHG
jgi:orotate phosphoribosyltransferase